MEHQLEARISALERNQEEFGHDLREMKGQIAKLMEMVKCLNRTNGIHPQEFQSLQTKPRLKQPLKEGQFVLDMTNISLSDPIPNPLARNYDLNAKCDYHMGAIEHSIEKCRQLKEKIENLIKDGSLTLELMERWKSVVP
ncbi:Uncharacterized protein TCM_040155 [Theobroma cacao]|uniref:Uncharacterized protein n=1 Tax=Theobroma cacao TaxID=3641 RepID=A0A061GYT2_THECC|nr:Uncharacterized protein TCM_040155 [Theobroma cacao]